MTAQYQTLIHIGCGAQPPLTLYRQLAEKTVLVDAADAVVNTLQQQASDTPQKVEVLQRVIAASTQPVCFYEYNLNWISSLKPAPEELKVLYPGLTLLRQNEHTAMGLPDLLGSISCGQPGTNLLILDLQDQAEDLLQALAQTKLLQLFACIVLPHQRQQAFRINNLPLQLHPAAGQLPAELAQALKQPEVYILHPWQQQLQSQTQLQQTLEQQNQQLQAQYQQANEAVQSAEQTIERLNEQIKGLQSENEAFRAEIDELQQRLKTRDAEQNTLRQQLDEANKQKEHALHQNHINHEGWKAEQARTAQLEQELNHANGKLEQARQQAQQTSLQLVQEQTSRQQLIEQEVMKAEAQLELIKDVLIRSQEA